MENYIYLVYIILTVVVIGLYLIAYFGTKEAREKKKKARRP